MSDDKLHLLERAFSPSAPIMSQDLFAGRITQIDKVCDAINEKGQHFVVFGDRGVGKTSFANIIDTKLTNVTVSKVTCSRADTFKHIWEKALAKVRFVRETQGVGFHPERNRETVQLDLFLPDKPELTSIDIQQTLSKVRSHLLFLFDEFDSISNREVQTVFADSIKGLSDNAPQVTIGIVGIAENVDGLIGKHASLERCLKQIEMPRMSKPELAEIIRTGLQVLDLRAGLDVTSEIVNFSSGFPHFTHLLAKFASREAILEGSEIIKRSHLERAISQALDNANQSIKTAYRRATLATKPESKFSNLVSACALADEDEYGSFSAKDLTAPFYKVSGKKVGAPELTYSLQKLCDTNRGRILQRVDNVASIRYRFSSPLMKTYVKLRLHQKGTFESPSLMG